MLETLNAFVKTELFLYLLFGFLTTLVNLIVFSSLCKAFKDNDEKGIKWKIAEVLAFIIAVIFAFITNKIFVFKNIDFSLDKLGFEATTFITGRVITEVINFLIMWYMIDKKKCNKMFTKILASVIVIILNYAISKLIVFR